MNKPVPAANKAALLKRLEMARLARQKMAGKGQAPASPMPGGMPVMPGGMNMMDMIAKNEGPKK